MLTLGQVEWKSAGYCIHYIDAFEIKLQIFETAENSV